jgi:hypothetical protein
MRILSDNRITDPLGKFSINGCAILLSDMLNKATKDVFSESTDASNDSGDINNLRKEFIEFQDTHPKMARIFSENKPDGEAARAGLLIAASILNTIQFHAPNITSSEMAKVINNSRQDISFLLRQSTQRTDADEIGFLRVAKLPDYKRKQSELKEKVIKSIRLPDLSTIDYKPKLQNKLGQRWFVHDSEKITELMRDIFEIRLDPEGTTEEPNPLVELAKIYAGAESRILNINTKAVIERVHKLLSSPVDFFEKEFSDMVKLYLAEPEKVGGVLYMLGISVEEDSDFLQYCDFRENYQIASSRDSLNEYFPSDSYIVPIWSDSGELYKIGAVTSVNSKDEAVPFISTTHYTNGQPKSELNLEPYLGCGGRSALTGESYEYAKTIIGQDIADQLNPNSIIYFFMGLIIKIRENHEK